MRQLSDKALVLVSRLYEQPGFWESLTRPDRTLPDVLTRLGQLREAAALPHLLAFAFHRRNEVAEAARAAVHLTLREVTTAQLPWLDEHVRQAGHRYGTSQGRHSANPSAVENLSGSLVALATFHRSGFVRQVAVEKIASSRDGTELPYLLLRLNDWVPQVRGLARESVTARLTDDYCHHFIECLPILERLESRSRADHLPILKSARALLQREQNRPVLRRAFSSADRSVRRGAFRIAVASPAGLDEQFLLFGIRSPDPVIRLWAVRLLPHCLPRARALEILGALNRDPFMPVRREALTGRIDKLRQPADDSIEEFLLDSHPSLRHLARRYLGRGTGDYAELYRKALRTVHGRPLASALGGLAETGEEFDVKLLGPFLEHPLGRVRRAAVRAHATLNLDASIDVLLEALEWPSPKVSKEASKILAGVVRRIDESQLWAIFSRSTDLCVKCNALVLLSRHGKWKSLPFLLRVVGTEQKELAGMARALIDKWIRGFNRDFSQPDDDAKAAIRRELSNAQGHLPAKLTDHIEFVINAT